MYRDDTESAFGKTFRGRRDVWDALMGFADVDTKSATDFPNTERR